MPHLAIGFFFLRRNKYEIAKVRYFPVEKLYIKAFSSFFLIIIALAWEAYISILRLHGSHPPNHHLVEYYCSNVDGLR
jgi:predicted transcriptional regulator